MRKRLTRLALLATPLAVFGLGAYFVPEATLFVLAVTGVIAAVMCIVAWFEGP